MTSDSTSCDCALLREHLAIALELADRCDPMVAIHVDAALSTLDGLTSSQDQSSER